MICESLRLPTGERKLGHNQYLTRHREEQFTTVVSDFVCHTRGAGNRCCFRGMVPRNFPDDRDGSVVLMARDYVAGQSKKVAAGVASASWICCAASGCRHVSTLVCYWVAVHGTIHYRQTVHRPG